MRYSIITIDFRDVHCSTARRLLTRY